jgi:acetoin utilization deacetylase AcuC-like enzyme
MALVLVTSETCAGHVPPPGHPERAERYVVMREVAARWRERGGQVLEPRPATRAELERVHAVGYLDRLAAAAGQPAVLDLDTYMSPGSWAAALAAAGAALTALEWVLDPAHVPGAGDAGLRAAAALVRPPGHHALRDRAMGFCLINNLAVAAAAGLARGLERLAIVDYDVHHGNGTQWCFYDDPRVLVVSLHQYPFYPHTGAAGECGVRAGEGFTVNVPLSAGATDADYLHVWRTIVEPVLERFRPQVLLADAGFDAHHLDPMAHMHVTTRGFATIAARLRAAAEAWSDARLAVVTEGGYHLDALRDSLEATVEALAAPVAAAAPADQAPTACGRVAVDLVRAAQRRYWPGI